MGENMFEEGGITRRRLLQGIAIGGGAVLVVNGCRMGTRGSADQSPVAETSLGKVRGVLVNGVSVFAGIPYGASTAGAVRFMPPAKAASWAGIRDATMPGTLSPQGVVPAAAGLSAAPDPNSFFFQFSAYKQGKEGPNRFEQVKSKQGEDCLVLNVASNGLKGKRPVLVYIHGGGYIVGDGGLALGADKWVQEQDIVVVGINHRLGLFGYTYLGGISDKYADSGNVGQMDLIMALEWVRDNIANFGGDPGNVTVFGESGGGAKINTLMATPKATGLFQKAIVESGSMLSVGTKEQATARAKALLASLGLKESQVDELQTVPIEKLQTAKFPAGTPEAQPCVDGRLIPQQTWTPEAPKSSAGIPMIIGNTKDESTSFNLSDEALFKLDEAGLRERVVKAGVAKADAEKLLALYKKDYPTENPTDTYFRMDTDRRSRRNTINEADRKLAAGPGNVYVYSFNWDTPLVGGKMRAFHTAEQALVVRRVKYPESEELSKQVSAAWAAFARTGDPTNSAMPKWEPYTTANRETMIFDVGKTRMEKNPSKDELEILAKYKVTGIA
jgi:para-nitrobenzyl esterase